MLKAILIIPIFFQFLTLGQTLSTRHSVDYFELKHCFPDPPAESRLRCYWWWLNSMATKESITRDLEEMKAKGYGGASIVDAGSSNYQVARKTAPGPVFMSPGWMELYKHAVKEAERLGIELSVNVQSGWNPGAPSITPDMALKKLVYTETVVKGGKLIKVILSRPEGRFIYQDVVVQAIPLPSKDSPVKNGAITNWDKKTFNIPIGWKGIYPLAELREGFENPVKVDVIKKKNIIDLTGMFSGEELTWDVPSGDWLVLRYGWTCTGARTSTTSDGWGGLSLDHLNPDAFELFRQTVIQPLIDSARAAGNSVKFLQTDSWEMGTVNWTNGFPEEFKKHRGYELDKYLPVLTGRVVESQEESNRFLHDFRKSIGDCVAENHYQLFADLAHKNGMGIHPESGGPHSAPVDALKVMAISDFPQGEFWAMANSHRVKDDERLSVKQSACVAHTNGKRFVAAEGPTSIGPQWERSPMELKGNIDRVFCSGVNRIVWHTFTSSPREFGLPGNEYFAGTHLNPNVTWWKQSKDFINYLNRCSYMLQQGLFVADVLYYYGDDVPNFVFLKEELPQLKFGYDWDKCSRDVILNRLDFDGKKIVLPDGMSYRVMMLPPDKAIDLKVLLKLEQLVKMGMILIGPRPDKATGLTNFPQNDRQIKEIAGRMWGKTDGRIVTENLYGKGRVFWGKDVNEVLSEIKLFPDVEFKGTHPKAAIDYIHRTAGDHEIYFVANRFSQKAFNDFEYRYLSSLPDRYEQIECKFRVEGKIPEIWNPLTGDIEEVVTYREENGQSVIPLLLEPEGSRFIIFRKAASRPHIIEILKDNLNVFPGFSLETKEYPYINFCRSGNGITADFSEPGTYILKWSDGHRDEVKLGKENETAELTGEWDIQFDPNWGAPSQLKTDILKSWTEFDIPGIKYYSGTAIYQKTFKLNQQQIKQKRLILDLGNVKEMASVKINGHQLQVMWNAPFLFDITPYVKSGNNELSVEVVNMWVNRLIGDGKLPPNQRLTKTNINKFDSPDAEKSLRLSGLMGPVKIKILPIKILK